MSDLLTTEAAAKLRVHPVTLRRMAREGRVAGAFRVGDRWRFRDDCTIEPARLPSATSTPRLRTRRPAPVSAELDAALALHRPTRGPR